MAASTEIIVFHGGSGGTEYSLASIQAGFVNPAGHVRFKQADNSVKDTNNPIPIPDTGNPDNYSYRKNMKIKFTSAPPNKVTNLRFFAQVATAIATGVVLFVGQSATYTQGSGSDISSLVVPSGVDAATYTSGSPLSITSGDVVGPATSFGSTGFGDQDYLVEQMRVSDTASAGDTSDRTYVFRYDEQ